MSKQAVAGLVGCGDVSSVHLEALAAMESVQLLGLADKDPVALGRALTAWPTPDGHTAAKGHADYRELLDALVNDGRPAVVHICTPHSEHVPMALEALRRGINVILEKPFAHTLKDAEALASAVVESEAKLALCFQNRYNETSKAIRNILDSGQLGRLVAANGTVNWSRLPSYYQDRPWRGTWSESGGGLMMNQAIHTLDLLLWYLGEPVALAGSASTRSLRGHIEVEDTAGIVMEHANDVRSTFHATLCAAENFPVTLDIQAEFGRIELNGDLVIHRDGQDPERIEETLPEGAGRSYWGASHALLIQDFYANLDEPGDFWIGAREGLATLRVVKELYAQSYPQGQWV